LADFLCLRKKFCDVIFSQNETIPSTQPCNVQLIICADVASFGGQRIVSAQAEKQWKLFNIFLMHPNEPLTLKQIAEILEKQGIFVYDFEQQIRRPINKIRERTEAIGYSKNTLISSESDGYRLNSGNFAILHI
jgi:DNA-binding response OmpR family regulator